MNLLDESSQRKALSSRVYWITLALMAVYFLLYFIFEVDPTINLTKFDSLVPVLLTIVSTSCIVLNRYNHWQVSSFLFLFNWLLLVNILPVILIGVSTGSYIVHPVLCIISSLMVQLFFSYYRNRSSYVVFLTVSFLLTVFSYDFLRYYDADKGYLTLPLNRFQVTTIYVMCWVFINLTLIYVYRIYWRTYNELQSKNEVIEKLNAGLEARVRQRTKQLEERNEQLKAYAYMNAHIIRAPLSRILGLVNLLKNTNHDPQEEPIIREYLNESARELDEIIRRHSANLETNVEEDLDES